MISIILVFYLFFYFVFFFVLLFKKNNVEYNKYVCTPYESNLCSLGYLRWGGKGGRNY